MYAYDLQIFIGILYGFIQKRRNVCCGKYSRPSIAMYVFVKPKDGLRCNIKIVMLSF